MFNTYIYVIKNNIDSINIDWIKNISNNTDLKNLILVDTHNTGAIKSYNYNKIFGYFSDCQLIIFENHLLMPIVLKLVGFTQDHKSYQIKDKFTGPINLRLLHELFIHWNLTTDDIDKIKFITDSEQIKNPDKTFEIKEDEERLIFVFTSDRNVRTKLLNIFSSQGTEVSKDFKVDDSPKPTLRLENADPEICKPLTQKKLDPVQQLTPDIIELMNVKSVSLFSDPDFKNLVSIYLRKPELFSTLSQYVQSGNVIEESFIPPKTIDQLTSDELEHYQHLAMDSERSPAKEVTHNIDNANLVIGEKTR